MRMWNIQKGRKNRYKRKNRRRISLKRHRDQSAQKDEKSANSAKTESAQDANEKRAENRQSIKNIDRLVAHMLGLTDIRDVIAFPKVQNASELMTQCPAPAEEKALTELSIAINIPDKNWKA